MAETKGTKQQSENNPQQNNPQQGSRGEQRSSSAIQPNYREGGQQRGITRRDPFSTSLWSGNPFTLMSRFADEMDRLFEDFGFGRSMLAPAGRQGLWPSGRMEQSVWSPQMEVFEREGQIVVRADLPGLNKDDIKIDITDDALTIQGERRQEHEQSEEGFYHSERSFGHFYRSIALPEGVDADNAKANFRDGVLEITIPAPQRTQRRRQIDIGEERGTQEQKRSNAQTSTKS
ncbi:MAG TPA: Hsp20/alpha crystallin family protein [Blastocatellia bacterium]|jgi:HSP20 family protein